MDERTLAVLNDVLVPAPVAGDSHPCEFIGWIARLWSDTDGLFMAAVMDHDDKSYDIEAARLVKMEEFDDDEDF